MSRIFLPETDLYIVHRQDAAKGHVRRRGALTLHSSSAGRT